MNRKQLIFLLAALIVLGGAGLVLLQRNRESWSQAETKMGGKVLPDFKPNDIAAIHIKGGAEVHLARKSDLWRVQERNDYPANFHQISDVLIKLKDLKVVEADTVDPSDLPRVNLDEPGKDGGGTLVEFADSQGKVLESLLVGKKHMRAPGEGSRSFMSSEPDGCYVLLPGDPKVVYLISDPLAALQANASSWLSRDFFGVEQMKSCALTAADPADSWKISRDSESSPWVLADAKTGETLDGPRTRQLADTLKMPRFTDVLPARAIGGTGLDNPRMVTIETFDHFTYTLKVGAKSPQGNYYMTVAVAADLPADDGAKKLREKLKQEQALAPWIYTVGSWIMDPLLRGRAQLLEGYKEEDASNAPAAKPKANAPTLPGDQTWRPRVIQ